MNRLNLFHQLHRGLRALLQETSLFLRRTDFSTEKEGQEAMRRVAVVVDLFRRCRQAEELFVLPAAGNYEPGVVAAFETEHEECGHREERIEALLAKLRRELLPTEKAAIGSRLVCRFTEYTLFAISHLAREEQVLNKILWRYYSDADLQRIFRQIWSATKLSQDTPCTKMMCFGRCNSETTRWMSGVRLIAKQVQFQPLNATAGAKSQPRRWRLLGDVLKGEKLFAN